MADLSAIANVPHVKSAVLSDASGAYLDAIREADGESVAAVVAFLTSSLIRVGEELGLGALGRLSFAGQSSACLVLVLPDAVLSAVIEPAGAFPAAERALDAALQG